MKKLISLLTFLQICFCAVSQTKSELETFSFRPKNAIQFPLDSKISLPTVEAYKWDHDYDQYLHFLTPELKKTQMSITYTDKGISTTVTTNSIIPHAQLDTTTIIKDKEEIKGNWRMITFRRIRFNDSVIIANGKYYRLPNEILDDNSKDDAYIVIDDKNATTYVKEVGKKESKKVSSGKYSMDNTRYIMMYKLAKGAAGVSQIGMDENGYLILNYPQVIELLRFYLLKLFVEIVLVVSIVFRIHHLIILDMFFCRHLPKDPQVCKTGGTLF